MSSDTARGPRGHSGWRDWLRDALDRPIVGNTIIALIVFNALVLGLETSDWVMARAGTALRVLDGAVLAVFVAEIVAKLVAHDRHFFRSPWNVFDFAIVGAALVPASGPLSILRALRILRLMRLLGRVPRLRRIVEALLRALPGIGWILLLLGLVFYVFAVMGTQLFGDTFPEYFGTLGKTLYTLFQVMTLESWSMGIARPVMAVHPWAGLYFVTFILITAFTILNLFIGVIVNTMQEGFHADDMRQRDEIEARAQAERAEMLRLIRDIDARLQRLEGGDGRDGSDR